MPEKPDSASWQWSTALWQALLQESWRDPTVILLIQLGRSRRQRLLRASVPRSLCDAHKTLSRNRRTNPTVMSCASRNTTQRNIFHSHLNPEEGAVCALAPGPITPSQLWLQSLSVQLCKPHSIVTSFLQIKHFWAGLIILSSLLSGKCIWIKGHLLNCLLSHKYFYQRKNSEIQLCVFKRQNSKKFYCQTFTSQ